MYIGTGETPQFGPPQQQGGGCMGCTDCAGKCGGGMSGLGLFNSGFDISGWGWGELLAIALGAYAAYSIYSTTRRGAQRVSSKARYIAESGKRSRRAKAARLRREADLLEKAA